MKQRQIEIIEAFVMDGDIRRAYDYIVRHCRKCMGRLCDICPVDFKESELEEALRSGR